MTADVLDITARLRRPNLFREQLREVYGADADSILVYHHVLLRDDVSFDELTRALKGSGIVLNTDKDTGMQILHRQPQPPNAA